MRAPSNSHKNRKTLPLWLFIVMIPLLMGLGALCVLWYWNTHKDAIIRGKIEQALEENVNELYKVRYDSTEVDEVEGNLSFYNLHLGYDTAKYLAAQRKGLAPPILFTVDIPEISVSGVQASRAMTKNEIIGQKLIIKNPVIDLYYTYQGKDADINMPTNEMYKEILGELKLVQADTIMLSDAIVRTLNSKTGRVLTEGKNINITLVDVKIDSTAFEDKSRLMFSKNVNIDVGNIKWASNDRLYNFSIGSISLNSSNNSLNVGRFDMKSALGEEAFARAMPFQDDRFDISMSNIRFTDVDAKKLLDGGLQAGTMTIPTASIKIYRDLGRPRDRKNRVGKYPHQTLDDIPLSIAVKKIVLNDSYFEYRERSPVSRQTNKVRFHHFNATLTNFTNDRKARGQEMTAVINTRLLDQTKFSTRWKFYLFHPKGRFDLSGSLGPMDATLFNQFMEPMGPSIRGGQLDGLEFNLQGSDHNMNGTVKMLYNDLKIDVFEMNKDASQTDKRSLNSFLANIVIKNSNPKKNEEARVVSVNMRRDINRSLFSFCWKTIFTGIMETVGIKQGDKSKPAGKVN